MFLFNRGKSELPTAESALPGRSEPILPNPRPHRCSVRRSPARIPKASRSPSSRSAASGARRRRSGSSPACGPRPSATQGGFTPNPTYEEVVHRPDRPRRDRARGVRPGQDELRAAAQGLLGEPRPDPGHAPGQRRRHAVPLGDLRPRPTQQQAAAEASQTMYQQQLTAAGYGDDHDRDRRPAGAAVLLRRGLPPAVPRKNPNGYCPNHATGVKLPDGWAVTPLQYAE